MTDRQSVSERRRTSRRTQLDSWPIGLRELGSFLIAYVLLVAVGLGLGWLLLGPLANTPLQQFDADLSIWLASRRTPLLDEITDFGSALAGTVNVVAGLAVLIVAFTWYWKRWRESLTLGFGLALEASVFLTVSLTVGRDRPAVEQLDISPPTASFPSGHTGAAFALYIGLALIVFWNTERTIPRALAVVGGIALPVSVALSRLYRGMHYMTDVVVGAALGTAALAVAAYIVTRAISRTESSE